MAGLEQKLKTLKNAQKEKSVVAGKTDKNHETGSIIFPR